jgi:transcription-repair coupling factor (superfamily II helicase)
VPRPQTRQADGEPLRDTELLQWCEELLATLLNSAPQPASGHHPERMTR